MANTVAHRPFSRHVPRIVREWLDGGDADACHRRIPGSMVFVDVSGFTKMSERLSRLGREGAEAVTEVISSCFNGLLMEAYAYEGTLLKFGGDALLLFFRGHDHERRAAAAALGMRAELRAHGLFHTPAGQVKLRMTVGVGTGVFDFFLVGASHREMIIAGKDVSEVVRLEGRAETGRILASHAIAAALPPANAGPDRGAGRHLLGTLDGIARRSVELYTVDLDLEPYVPLALRSILAEGSPLSEHRRVTVAFIHFSGLDSRIDDLGPARVADDLHDLVSSVQRAVDRRGLCFLGTDVAPNGGKIILTAGAPVSVGADEEQMLLALRETVEKRLPLPVRIGVNNGYVFAGEIGTVHRRTYTVMGDAVNLAARVMAKAEHDQIIATRTVIETSRTVFETDMLEPFLVKGKQHPVTAAAVGPARSVRADISAAALPFVGRDVELARLRAVAGSLEEGSGRLVEIVGEPGAGKTRLLDEWLRRSVAVPVHRSQCRLYQASTPYFPVRGLLRSALGIGSTGDAVDEDALVRLVDSRAPQLRPWLPLIGVPLGIELPDTAETSLLVDRFRKSRLEDAVAQLLAQVIDRPTVLCIEDTQWMDEASSDLVRSLARRLEFVPWMFCLTRRPVDSGFVAEDTHRLERIELAGLADGDISLLVANATRHDPMPAHVVTALAARSQGNPLYALELLDGLRATGDLDALPPSVEGLISARIDRLDPRDRRVLRHLSVLGNGFGEEHAHVVLDDDPEAVAASAWAMPRLEEFLERSSDGWIRFRQLLVRDVAYGGLPYRTRSELHGRVAQSIQQSARSNEEGVASLLSLHFFYARRYEEAWQYSRMAGDSARSVYANIEAANLYERALLAARHVHDLHATDRAETLETLGDVQDLAGLYDDALHSYRTARKYRSDDAVGRARLDLKEAFVQERRGRYREAIRCIRRGERLLDGMAGGDAAALRAQLVVWYAAIRANQGKPRDAMRWSRRGIELAERAGDRSALARAYLVLDFAESSIGQSAGAEHSVRALEIYTQLDDLGGQGSAANSLGSYAYFDGRWNEAIEFYATSRSARLKTGDPVNAALADANIAEIYIDQGHLADAEAMLREVAAVWAGAGDRWGIAFASRLLGVAAARSGRGSEADHLLATARRVFDEIGARSDVLETDLRIAECLLLQARGDEGLALLQTAVGDDAGGLEHLRPALHRLRGIALVQTGDEERGREQLEAAIEWARRQRADHHLAWSLETLHLIDRSEVAGFDLDRSREYLEIYERLGVIARPSFGLEAVGVAG